MTLNEGLFYNGTEGFLGKPEDCRLLFLLKEPDSSGTDVEEGRFWFQEVYQGEKKGAKYLEPLRRIASLLLPDTEDPLSCVAYINLHPVKGGNYESKDFRDTLKKFKNGSDIFNRWDIIKAMPDGGCVVTTKNIFNAALYAVKNNLVKGCCMVEQKPALMIAGRVLCSFLFQTDGKMITVLSMYHPVYMSRNGWKASDIILAF